MNDFTKEELQLLLLSYWPSPYCIEPAKDLLYKKIQSMIENYCEPQCIHCGCNERHADLSAPPEELCPLNPGCEYE